MNRYFSSKLSFLRRDDERDLDRGSIAPLGIGFAVISLTLVFVFLASSSLYIFQKRLRNYSEGLALYVAESGDSAQNYLFRVGNQEFQKIELRTRLLADGVTVQATTCARWESPVPIVIAHNSRQICANAQSRIE
jgi:hypothetical protein